MIHPELVRNVEDYINSTRGACVLGNRKLPPAGQGLPSWFVATASDAMEVDESAPGPAQDGPQPAMASGATGALAAAQPPPQTHDAGAAAASTTIPQPRPPDPPDTGPPRSAVDGAAAGDVAGDTADEASDTAATAAGGAASSATMAKEKVRVNVRVQSSGQLFLDHVLRLEDLKQRCACLVDFLSVLVPAPAF
jgi:hypothetical protein